MRINICLNNSWRAELSTRFYDELDPTLLKKWDKIRAATGDGLTTILASRFCPPDGKMVNKKQAKTFSTAIL